MTANTNTTEKQEVGKWFWVYVHKPQVASLRVPVNTKLPCRREETNGKTYWRIVNYPRQQSVLPTMLAVRALSSVKNPKNNRVVFLSDEEARKAEGDLNFVLYD